MRCQCSPGAADAGFGSSSIVVGELLFTTASHIIGRSQTGRQYGPALASISIFVVEDEPCGGWGNGGSPVGSRSMNQPKNMGIRLPAGDIGSEGVGYVWHCHIIDPEDNEMMRPYKVIKLGGLCQRSWRLRRPENVRRRRHGLLPHAALFASGSSMLRNRLWDLNPPPPIVATASAAGLAGAPSRSQGEGGYGIVARSAPSNLVFHPRQ